MKTQQNQKGEKMPTIHYFKIGEKFLWNCGYSSLITAILKQTNSFITYQVKSSGAFICERRLKKDRLVAIG